MLKFLGVIFLVLIGLVVAFFTWLFFKVRSGAQQQANVTAIEKGLDTPTVVLEPAAELSLKHAETVAELVEQAVGAGAALCGNYNAPAADTRLCVYRLENPPVYIVVYDHDQVDPWTDVVLRFEDDKSFTASTVPEIARGAPRHPDDEIEFFAPGTATGVLIQAAAERTQGMVTLPAAAEAFKTYFEATIEKSQEFIRTQAISQDWLTSIADDAGVELTGGEAEQINFARETQLAMDTENGCFKSLAESGRFTAAEWDELRDSLVAVWDDMPAEYVPGVFYSHVEIPEDLEDAVDELEEADGQARKRVAEFNARLPERKRLVFVGSVSSPVAADIYRGDIAQV